MKLTGNKNSKKEACKKEKRDFTADLVETMRYFTWMNS